MAMATATCGGITQYDWSTRGPTFAECPRAITNFFSFGGKMSGLIKKKNRRKPTLFILDNPISYI